MAPNTWYWLDDNSHLVADLLPLIVAGSDLNVRHMASSTQLEAELVGHSQRYGTAVSGVILDVYQSVHGIERRDAAVAFAVQLLREYAELKIVFLSVVPVARVRALLDAAIGPDSERPKLVGRCRMAHKLDVAQERFYTELRSWCTNLDWSNDGGSR